MVLTLPLKREIYFNEAEHRYTDDYNTVYKSVTTIIKDYEIPFDREYWLKYKAEKLNVSENELSKEWETITEEACIKGRNKHEYLEESVNKFYSKGSSLCRGEGKILSEDYLIKSDLRERHADIFYYLIDLINKGFILYSEKRIYNYQLGVCGTIDVLAVREKEFIVIDWKTNKKVLYFKSGYYKKNYLGIETNIWVIKDERFKHPLDNIPFCKGSIYGLQLSTYALLVELFGMKCLELNLWHIRDNSTTMYNMRYCKEEVEQMLVHNFKNRI